MSRSILIKETIAKIHQYLMSKFRKLMILLNFC